MMLIRKLGRTSLRLLAVAVAVSPAASMALIIDTYTPFAAGETDPNSDLVNTSRPADDPGWSNLTSASGIYLGDHWFMTAVHANGGVDLQFAGGNFPIIPGTYTRLTNTGSLDTQSDVALYRVGVDTTTGLSPEELDPTIQEIQIAGRTVSLTTTLTMFGRGRNRILNSTPQVDDQTGETVSAYTFFDSNGAIVSDPVAGGYTGYTPAGGSPGVWQWGRNRRTSTLTITGGQVSDTQGFLTRFDQNGEEFEAQGAGGDSGGPVFWKDGEDWVLAGLMHAIYYPPNESSNNLLYAFQAQTGISNLASSNYRNQIAALRAQVEYSIVGDLDLDGVADGDITGGDATGDLGILVDNWLREFETADIHSWMAGDLNQDAVVDLSDFVLMRSALGGSIDTSSFAALVGVTVPEPSAAALAATALLTACRRRRR